MKRLEVKPLTVETEENPIGKDSINLKGELSKTETSSSFGVKQSKSTSWGQCKYEHFLQQTSDLSASYTYFPLLLVEIFMLTLVNLYFKLFSIIKHYSRVYLGSFMQMMSRQ